MAVESSSKPELVDQLAATWRKSSQHFAEQVERFIRLTVVAAVPSVVSLVQGGHFDYKTLLAFILPFAEVAFRQVWPALDAKRADSAKGVTIVPDEVCPPTPVALTGVVPPASQPVVPVAIRGPADVRSKRPSAKKKPVKKAVKKAPAKKTAAKKVTPKKR